jgi:hypothetical protein
MVLVRFAFLGCSSSHAPTMVVPTHPLHPPKPAMNGAPQTITATAVAETATLFMTKARRASLFALHKELTLVRPPSATKLAQILATKTKKKSLSSSTRHRKQQQQHQQAPVVAAAEATEEQQQQEVSNLQPQLPNATIQEMTPAIDNQTAQQPSFSARRKTTKRFVAEKQRQQQKSTAAAAAAAPERPLHRPQPPRYGRGAAAAAASSFSSSSRVMLPPIPSSLLQLAAAARLSSLSAEQPQTPLYDAAAALTTYQQGACPSTLLGGSATTSATAANFSATTATGLLGRYYSDPVSSVLAAEQNNQVEALLLLKGPGKRAKRGATKSATKKTKRLDNQEALLLIPNSKEKKSSTRKRPNPQPSAPPANKRSRNPQGLGQQVTQGPTKKKKNKNNNLDNNNKRTSSRLEGLEVQSFQTGSLLQLQPLTGQEKSAILKLKKAGVTATNKKASKTTLQQQPYRDDNNDEKAPTAQVSIPAAVEQAPSISHAIPPDDLRPQSPSLIAQHKQLQLDWQSRVMGCGDCVGCTTVHNCDRCQQCILRQYAPSSQQLLLRCMHRICGAPIIIDAAPHHDDRRRGTRMGSPPSSDVSRSTLSWRAVVSTAKKQETGLFLPSPRSRPDPPPTTTAEEEASATASRPPELDAGGMRSVVPLTASRGDDGHTTGTFHVARKMQLEP